jgi:hypothetical protein
LGVLHQLLDDFIHQCASMAWLAKGINGFLIIILHVFYKQRMLLALQKAQVASILNLVAIGNEDFFKLIALLGLLP